MTELHLVRTALCALVLGGCVAGCQDILPNIDFERMIDQPRGKAYRASSYFADGRLMQPPPANTVPRSAVFGPPEILHGKGDDGAYVTTVPVPLTRAVLQRGRSRFDIFCATCHGVDGSGESQVAQNMTSRKPPSLVSEPVLSFPAGRVYSVITHGYGLMPEYQRDLDVSDRWAVVSYLRALQRSRSIALASLPEAVQRKAKEVLR